MRATLVISLLTTVAGAAQAQTASSQLESEQAASAAASSAIADHDSGEIIVTAQKRSERLSDVPLSITALTGDQLVARGITDTAQLERIVPGFTVQKTYLGQPVFYLRGIGFSDASVSASPTVSIYTDEIPMPFSAMARGAAMDLARVEVLKGPQGTLFGQNATGGAVNYIVGKPTDSFQSGFDASIDRFSSVTASGFVSGPLTPGINARLSVQTEQGGDWQKSISRDGDERGAKNFMNGRLVLAIEPDGPVRFDFIAQAWKDKSDTQAPQFTIFTPTRSGPAANQEAFTALAAQVAAPRDPRAADWDPNSPTARDDRFYQVALRGELELGDSARVTSITAYNDLQTYSPIDLDGTPFGNGFYEPVASAETFSQEVRIDGEIGRRLKWLIGANYQRADTEETFAQTLNVTNSAPFFYTKTAAINNQKVDTYAGFGSIDLELSDTLTARASGRYTSEKRDFAGCFADGGDGVLANAFATISGTLSGQTVAIGPGECVTLDDTTNLPLDIVNKSLKENNFSWRTGLDWKVNPNTLVYANVAKGYKSGAFSGVVALFARQLNPVVQESVLAYEIGVKTALADRRLQLTAATFYYDYSDKQLQGYIISPFGPLTTLRNVPSSSVKGIEFDVVVRPVDLLKLQVSGTYLNTRVKSDPPEPRDPLGVPTTLVGESFPYTPDFQLTADIEQRIPLSDSAEAYLGASMVHHSSTSAAFGRDSSQTTRQIFTIGAYTLFDARAGVSFNHGRIVAEIWGRNIFNKYYLTNITRIIDTVPRYTGMPANYGLRVSWRY